MNEVITVRGPLSPTELGVTLTHEHVLCDCRNWMIETDDPAKLDLQRAFLSMEILGAIRRDIYLNEDNLVLSNADVAISEIHKYKVKGGTSLVDMTTHDIGKDPLSLRKISEATGVNIVCGTGWYVHDTHPALIREKTVQELAEMMIAELKHGIGNTGVRAGIIGEIGLSVPIHPDEKKVLHAAVKAQQETGAAISVHPPLFDLEKKVIVKEGGRIVDMVERFGGVLQKIVLSHSDATSSDLDYHRSLLEKGMIVSYDSFGLEGYADSLYVGCLGKSDWQRVNAFAELCQQGYEKQLLMSHDVFQKTLLTKYGGYGYAHILEHIIPMLRQVGVSDKQVTTIMVDNPKRILPF